jgi:phenylacetate-CoA ligase
LKEAKLASHYLLEVSKEGPLDRLDVLVELKPEFSNVNKNESDAVAKSLAHNFKSLIRVTAGVKIVPISGIERSVGKAKRVLDKRPKG